jgi:hypothetical protein
LVKGANEDEISDILTNLLACASNLPEAIDSIDKLISGYDKFDKTYEFYFNMCLV